MTTPSQTNSPTEEQIAHRARELWKERGNPTGQDTDIWLEAERLLRTTTAADNAPSASGGRGNGNSQASKTPSDPKPSDLKKPTPGGSPSTGKTAPSAASDPSTGAKGLTSKEKPGVSRPVGQTERLRGEMASESEVEFQITPAVPDDEAIKAALQKRDARAPKAPTKTAPHAKPPETGKPLWDKPHSS